MLQEATRPRSVGSVLTDSRRIIEAYGWRPPRVPAQGFEVRHTITELVEAVAGHEPAAVRATLEALAIRQGWLPAIVALLGLSELQAVVDAWENDPARTLADILRVLS